MKQRKKADEAKDAVKTEALKMEAVKMEAAVDAETPDVYDEEADEAKWPFALLRSTRPSVPHCLAQRRSAVYGSRPTTTAM